MSSFDFILLYFIYCRLSSNCLLYNFIVLNHYFVFCFADTISDIEDEVDRKYDHDNEVDVHDGYGNEDNVISIHLLEHAMHLIAKYTLLPLATTSLH